MDFFVVVISLAKMGMGKTIQAVSLILYNRPLVSAGQSKAQKSLMTKQKGVWDDVDRQHAVDPKSSIRAGTLIVVPMIAIRQW